MRKRKIIKKITAVFVAVFIIASSFMSVSAINTEYQTWKQGDPRWAGITFGSIGDTMASAGCAITAVSMLMVHSDAVSDDPEVFNPGVLVSFLNEHEGFTYEGGIYWASPEKYTDKFQFVTTVNISGTVAEKTQIIKDYADEGKVIVAMVRNGGHYVAVNRVLDGTVYIFDSSYSGHDRLFDYEPDGVTRLILYRGPTNGEQNSLGGVTVENPLGAQKSENGYYTGTYTITSSDGVNMRTGPSTDYEKLPTGVGNGVSVTVTDVDGSWGKVKYSGYEGWICLDYAAMTSPVMTGIHVTPPTKLSYRISQNLDLTGMKVYADYSDGSSVMFVGYTLKKEPFVTGENRIDIEYYGLSSYFTVLVYGKREIGDANGDYVIDAADALAVLQFSVGKTDGSGITFLYSDVDSSGTLDSADALLILQYAVGKIASF